MRTSEQSGGKVGNRRWVSGCVTETAPARLLLIGAVVFAAVGCSEGTGGSTAKSAANARSVEVVHEPCATDSSGAERVDANGDGTPDVTMVKEAGVEHCRASDLDFDGQVDLYSYFDKSGAVIRRELDYNRDGDIDEIQLFKDGVILEKHRASTTTKRLDTWEIFSQGQLVKAERDSDGNGKVDQWWAYKSPDCPMITTDVDGNGEPDPSAQVDFCAEASYKPPEQTTAAPPSMLNKETQALPTETSNKEVAEPSDSAKADAPKAPANQSSPAPAKQGKPNE